MQTVKRLSSGKLRIFSGVECVKKEIYSKRQGRKSSCFKKVKGLGTLSVNLVSQQRVLINGTENVVLFNLKTST